MQNPVAGIQNPRLGIQNPRHSLIPLYRETYRKKKENQRWKICLETEGDLIPILTARVAIC